MSETLTPAEAPAAASSPIPRRRPRNWIKVGATVLLLAVLVLLPVPIGDEVGYLKLAQYVLIGVVGGIGLTLLVGQAGQLSLAHPFFLLVGAVSYAVLAGDPQESADLVGLGLPPLFAVLGAVVISGVFGLAFAPVAGRLRGIYLGVASLSLVFLGLWLGQSLYGLTGGTSSGRSVPAFDLFGFPFTNTQPAPTILGVAIQKQQRLWYLFLAFAVLAYFLARGAVQLEDRAGLAGGARQRGRSDRDGGQRLADQGRRVHRVLGVRRAGRGDDRALARPGQTRRERVHRHLLADRGHRLPGHGDHRRVGFGARRGASGAVVVYGLQQFFLLGANEFGWFADAGSAA